MIIQIDVKQEDYIEREMLLAMLSVGDPVYYVDDNVINGHVNGIIEKFTVVQAPYKSTSLGCLQVKLSSPFSDYVNQELHWIDAYQGKLYVWNCHGWYRDDEYEKRMEKLISIIESGYTIFR